jgi:magnesium transporter
MLQLVPVALAAVKLVGHGKLWRSIVMLQTYGTEKGCLVEHGPVLAITPGTVWIDLVEPTHDEEVTVESSLNIDIPTRGELAEIEASSRLYQEDGAAFMTATLIRRGDDERPESSPVTFIIKGNQLITIRYHHPQAFPVYIRQALKPQATAMTGWGILISLMEAVVDRAADHLERVSAIIDDTSKKVFDTSFVNKQVKKERRRRKPKNLEELLGMIGEEGDFNSKMRESLVSIGRMVAYMQAIIDQTKLTREMKENRARIKILQRDISSLTDHASFLSGKISFLLDAVLGMISIQQNGIIKIFSVAAVVFLPPTLVASLYGMNFKHMPELEWTYGYPWGIGLMILSAILPFMYFKQKGWL